LVLPLLILLLASRVRFCNWYLPCESNPSALPCPWFGLPWVWVCSFWVGWFWILPWFPYPWPCPCLAALPLPSFCPGSCLVGSALPCLALGFALPSLPCHTLPCLALPCLALPCLASTTLSCVVLLPLYLPACSLPWFYHYLLPFL